MQVNFGETEIKDLLSKVKIFNNQMGEYQLHTVNDQFQYFVKLSNGSIILSIDNLIDNQNQQLNPAKLAEIALRYQSTIESNQRFQEEPKKQRDHFEQPKITYSEPVAKPSKPRMSGLRIVSISLGIIILLAMGMAFFNDQNSNAMGGYDSPKTEEELKQELLNKEQSQPTNYLSGRFSSRSNFFGNQVFEGNLTNSATLCGFKDVRIRITAKAATGYELDSREYVITEFVEPNGKTTFKFETESWDDDTEDFEYTIVSADTY
jgi:hypothetical protein